MACGRPVIALGRGGAVETVVSGTTGLLVAEPTPAAFADAMNALPHCDFAPAPLAAHAARFSTPRFETAFARTVTEVLAERQPC